MLYKRARQFMPYSSETDAPSQFLSSSAFRFFAATSSSFFLASRPSFARFILMALEVNKVRDEDGTKTGYELSSSHFLVDQQVLGLQKESGLE